MSLLECEDCFVRGLPEARIDFRKGKPQLRQALLQRKHGRPVRAEPQSRIAEPEPNTAPCGHVATTWPERDPSGDVRPPSAGHTHAKAAVCRHANSLHLLARL